MLDLLQNIYSFFQECSQLAATPFSAEQASQTAFFFSKDSFIYLYPTNYALPFTLKVTLGVCFLILIRGGVPRYRYDFLTKIGWVKFLINVLGYFVIFLVLYLIY